MMITTHNLKQPAKAEPQKLNQITTSIIPDAVPKPAPVGDGFAKMITTNDEPGPKFKIVITEPKPDEPLTGAVRWINDQFKSDMEEADVVKVDGPVTVAPAEEVKAQAPKSRKPRKAKKD